eukprot:Skav221374  [mRNA]  locus=scaffold2286:240166:245711:- [translate_table: standard]
MPISGGDLRAFLGKVEALQRCRGDHALYRCIYGLARIHSGRGSAQLLRAAQGCAVRTLGHPEALMPRQLVTNLRVLDSRCWFSQPQAAAEILLVFGTWKLIHDVERAMKSRGDDESAKRPRKTPFRRRWTRADLMHTVLQG